MLKQLQTEEILRLTRTGIWQLEMEQGSSPRLYANDIMDEMLGVKTPAVHNPAEPLGPAKAFAVKNKKKKTL